MDRISFLLPKVLEKRGMKNEADASLLVHTANIWLSEHSAPEDAEATIFKEDALMIECSSAASSQDCHALSEDLLSYLRQSFPHIPLKRIVLLRERERR